eukprot:CAMPEP_0118634444 /NCGR_PEP_ID=MMETSP0785-20121206/1548_1 /TAXON_ID=91992 /ORGANISM="Bolidomonas pacifica, Strain CCMP 1866" /LENGTH=163 /DNA_ID=CAMNT_0006525415 /DNA_START=96 /DNA_END=584 /DNA_ORIENTATION=+
MSKTAAKPIGGGRASLDTESLDSIIDLLSLDSEDALAKERVKDSESRRRHYLKQLVAKHNVENPPAPCAPKVSSAAFSLQPLPPTPLAKVRCTLSGAIITGEQGFRPQAQTKKAVVFATSITLSDFLNKCKQKLKIKKPTCCFVVRGDSSTMFALPSTAPLRC